MQNWLKTWQEVASHWQKLRPYFRPLTVRLFVSWFALAPIFVYATRELPSTLPIAFGGTQYQLALELPFNWLILWVASLFYFLAFAIYVTSCPRFVKEFPDFATFIEQRHSPRFLVWELARAWREYGEQSELAKRLIDKQLAKPITQLTTGENPRVEKRGTVFEFTHNQRSYECSVNETTQEADQRELFWEIFGPQARHGSIRRNTSWAFIGLSFLLVTVVVIQHIWVVGNHLMTQ